MAFDWSGPVDYMKRNALGAPKTQYELPVATGEDHEGVPVAVVPLRHAVVTARPAFPAGHHDAMRAAPRRLAAALGRWSGCTRSGPREKFIQVV